MGKPKAAGETPSPVFLNSTEDPSQNNTENLSLVAKIITNQFIPLGVVKHTINRSWGLQELAEVQPLKFNVFLISFHNEADKKKAWSYRPWSVQGFHLLLQPWKEDTAVEKMDLNRTVFWVQVHGLPSSFVSEENAIKIGDRLGQLEYIDINNRGGVMKKLRLRVQWDVWKPLLPGLPLPRKDQADDWIYFKYEKLSEFCLKCGRLGHDFKFYKERKTGETINTRNVNLKKLGPWMCAAPTKGRRQQDFIVVPQPEREVPARRRAPQEARGNGKNYDAEMSNQSVKKNG